MNNEARPSNHHEEIAAGERFEFGKNWSSFLRFVNEERIREAMISLQKMLEIDRLDNKTFLDIGCGSGLFSLAARMLGGSVYSFDYDPQSVACTKELKKRYFPNDKNWIVNEGSVLDQVYTQRLGQFDIVYSWGVLHHTGAMWQALQNIASLVRDGGSLYIAIYNDQGGWSRIWKKIKRIYNQLPKQLRVPFAILVMGSQELRYLSISILKLDMVRYLRDRFNYGKTSQRGMSYWHDLIDWIGGYPYEVARPEEIFRFYRGQGFSLDNLRTSGGRGCNEYVFRKRNEEQ